MPNVLVVDDDRSIHLLVQKALELVADVTSLHDAAEVISTLRRRPYDVVLLDIQLPDRNGMALLHEIQELDRRLPIIFMTIEATSHTAIEAMQMGAFDYLAKPLAVDALRVLVERAIEQRSLSSVPVEIAAEDHEIAAGEELFIGQSTPMLEVFKAIGRVSKQAVPVLIRGESGTGKELVARALYQYSHRADKPFLAVNCAALPDSLLESELFGHEKGAFTSADSRRIGKFEQCNGGTLFLDEIGDMSPNVQAKVLRVLQEQRFERIGGNKVLDTDVRIVAATNQPLERMVADGEFREDLLYRLNGVTITLPPLHQRGQDIKRLIQYFLSQAKREMDKPDLQGLAPEAVELLVNYKWPGNVRQLRSVVRRCVLDSFMPVITPDLLPAELFDMKSNGAATMADNRSMVDDAEVGSKSVPPGAGLPELVERRLSEKSTDLYAEALQYMERYVLLRVLRETKANQSQAAEILGITRGKLRDRIQVYKISLGSDVSIDSQQN